jgi:hypothetical protein
VTRQARPERRQRVRVGHSENLRADVSGVHLVKSNGPQGRRLPAVPDIGAGIFEA